MNSDPSEIPTQLPLYVPLVAAMIGGGLSIIGGFAATVFRLRVEKKQEIDYIKISLVDELEEIGSVIAKMIETYRTSKSIPMVYFNNLTENTKSFDSNKLRLFLVEDKKVRRCIHDFYKDLESEVIEAKTSVGSLKPDGEGQADIANTVINKFTAIQAKAEITKQKIEAYKFKAFYFI